MQINAIMDLKMTLQKISTIVITICNKTKKSPKNVNSRRGS